MSTRYNRQIRLIGEEAQEKLKNSCVYVIGAGGIGNIAAKFLASTGVGHVCIFDGDHVEESNLNRQLLFNTDCIGKGKSRSLAEVIRKINPDIKTTYAPIQITEDSNIRKWMDTDNCNLILDCTDNLETSYLLEEVCIEREIPLLFAKTSNYSGNVKLIKDEPYLEKTYTTKQLNKDHDVFPAIGAIVGGFQASLAIKYLAGLQYSTDMFYFDLLNDAFIKYSV